MNTHSTLGAAAAPSSVHNLIADHINAVAEVDRLFQLEDWGLVDQGAVFASIHPTDVAVIALCAARPSDSAEIELRRAYLNAVLPDVLYDNLEMTKLAIHWMLNTDGESFRNGEELGA